MPATRLRFDKDGYVLPATPGERAAFRADMEAGIAAREAAGDVAGWVLARRRWWAHFQDQLPDRIVVTPAFHRQLETADSPNSPARLSRSAGSP